MIFSITLTALSLLFNVVYATVQSDTLIQPGVVAENLNGLQDSTQRYSVYLPSKYQRSRPWPVVYIMDPRGRALYGLDLFKEAAEEMGYILLSSYNTLSDGPEQPNIDALNTMINDSFDRFSIDTTRFYLAGFSGTSRLAWPYGYQLKNYVAGVIGFGAGPAPGFFLQYHLQQQGIAFSYYGGSAYFDFNYFEMLGFSKQLQALDYPSHVKFYEGIHSWPPEEICRAAIYWMQLQAMKNGQVPVDRKWIDKRYVARIAEAVSLQESGMLYEAWWRYTYIHKDFNGVRSVSEVQQMKRELEQNPQVVAARRTLDELAERLNRYRQKLGSLLEKYETSDSSLNGQDIAEELGLDRLIDQSQDSVHKYASRGARVILENFYVRFSFYEVRKFLDTGNPEKALPLLKVAERIKFGYPRNNLQYARVYAALDDTDKAVRYLRKLAHLPWITPAYLNNDPQLRKLKDRPAYLNFLNELGEDSTGDGIE